MEFFDTGTAVAITTMVTSLLTWWVKRAFDKKAKNAIPNYLDSASEIYGILREVCHTCDAARAFVIKTENGGGVPKAHHSLYSTILYEYINGEGDAMKGAWQRQLLDEGYNKLLQGIVQQDVVSTTVEELGSGILTDAYLANGIQAGVFAQVSNPPKHFVYLAVVFSNQGTHSGPGARDAVRATVNKLGKIFR